MEQKDQFEGLRRGVSIFMTVAVMIVLLNMVLSPMVMNVNAGAGTPPLKQRTHLAIELTPPAPAAIPGTGPGLVVLP